MNLEEALVILDTFFKPKPLSNVQDLVFRQSWEGKTYAEIASESDYDHDYIRDVGFRLWQMLSAELGEKVTKSNVRSILRHYSYMVSQENQNLPRAIASRGDRSWPFLECHQTRWVGRETLIGQLREKLQADCRVLSIVGITGIGKSSLAVKLALELKHLSVKVVNFDAEPPTFATVARCLLGEEITQNQPKSGGKNHESNPLSQPLSQAWERGAAGGVRANREPNLLVNGAIEYLHSQPCLLILDMVEEILETGKGGKQRFQDPTLAEFCDRLLKADTMPSRLILTSQERLPTIAQGRYLERSHLQPLAGLNEAEALEIFAIWDVLPDAAIERSHLQRIARAYEGHPLALQVIAGEIREPPFNGKVTAYWYEYGEEIAAVEWHKHPSDGICSDDKLCLDRYSLNLTELVKVRIEKTFDRLQRSSKLAYLLLCRGAAYRRAVERSAWLFLIAEYPPQEQMLAFQILQRCFLLQPEYLGGKVLYRLHHLIRSVANNSPYLEIEILPAASDRVVFKM